MLFLILVAVLLSICEAGSTCIACNTSSCPVCAAAEVTADGNNKKITIDVSQCKGSSISWMCIFRNSGADQAALQSVSCDGKGQAAGNKCDEVTKMEFVVPLNQTFVTVQLHDGRFAGNKICGINGKGSCCGGSGSSCAASGVCEVSVDLTGCPCPSGNCGTSIVPPPLDTSFPPPLDTSFLPAPQPQPQQPQPQPQPNASSGNGKGKGNGNGNKGSRLDEEQDSDNIGLLSKPAFIAVMVVSGCVLLALIIGAIVILTRQRNRGEVV